MTSCLYKWAIDNLLPKRSTNQSVTTNARSKSYSYKTSEILNKQIHELPRQQRFEKGDCRSSVSLKNILQIIKKKENRQNR